MGYDVISSCRPGNVREIRTGTGKCVDGTDCSSTLAQVICNANMRLEIAPGARLRSQRISNWLSMPAKRGAEEKLTHRHFLASSTEHKVPLGSEGYVFGSSLRLLDWSGLSTSINGRGPYSFEIETSKGYAVVVVAHASGSRVCRDQSILKGPCGWLLAICSALRAPFRSVAAIGHARCRGPGRYRRLVFSSS